MSIRSTIASRSASRPRSLRLESLETRAMMSHPAVAAVNVAGTQWSAAFVSNLESSGLGCGGYAVPVGSSNQLLTLPWTNIDQIKVTFSEDVVVKASDLSVSGVNTVARAFSDFSYNSTTHVATWTLATPITKDKILLDLDADGMSPVVSVSTDEVLDGAWVNGSSTFNSGNGQGGTDFEFRINVLPGDVNASNTVSGSDGMLVRSQIGKSIGNTGYNIRYDIDGDGSITATDLNKVQLVLGGSLPSGDPVGMTDDAPSTSSIPDLGVATGTLDHVLALTDFFDDAESTAAGLAYSIVQNSNASLFDSVSIDSSGNLTIEFDDSAYGDATLTIRATDPSGLFVETPIAVYVSDAPVIADFYCINECSDMWTLTGTVTDTDDPVEGDVVYFGGALASYNLTATVREDGVFCITQELIGLQEGTCTAQAQDPHGVLSDLFYGWILT